MRATRTLAAIGLCLFFSGCFSSNVKVIPYMPDPGVKGITPEKAKEVLGQIMARARTGQGQPLEDVRIGDDRLQFSWTFMERWNIDFAYAEVTSGLFQFEPGALKGGDFGVGFRRGGKDIPYGYFLVPTLEDAQTVADAVAVLGAVKH